MRRRWAVLPILVLASHLLLGGCGILDPDDSKGSTVALDGKVTFSIADGRMDYLSEGPPEIVLDMATERIYGCSNYSIVADVRTTADSAIVSLHHIYKPWICLTALGPAASRDRLALPIGVYSLCFEYRSDRDAYELVVTDSLISVHGPAGERSTPKHPLMWRVPARSFVCICGTTTDLMWMCSEFVDSLLTLPLYEFSFPDSGTIPYPTSGAGHQYDAPATYFKYSTEADYDSAGAALARYTRDVIGEHQGVTIQLSNWRNKHYCSWLLAR
jgi:hypothetical protein